MENKGYALGIDIGTTYTAAAIAAGERVEPLNLGSQTTAVPSVVTVRADGELLVGEAAERRAVAEPGRVARQFKRRMGDPTALVVGGAPFSAEALMARLLRTVVDTAVGREGYPPAAVVVTHPATYGPYKRELLGEMVRLAGVAAVEFLTEPEAAAIDYAGRYRLESGEIVAVYDFGGGTFDAAVLRNTGHGFELLGQPEGIERLGGIDFDEAVFSHVNSSVGGAIAELDLTDDAARAAVARLRADARLAKEALSSDTDTTIPLLLPSIRTDVRLTRAELEEMIRPRIGETVEALERAVGSAGLEFKDISRILLVGGSSRIPLVSELVREATGRPVVADADPKLAIALGAARFGKALLQQAHAAEPSASDNVQDRNSGIDLSPGARASRRRYAGAALGILPVLALAGAAAAFALSGPGLDVAPTQGPALMTAGPEPASPSQPLPTHRSPPTPTPTPAAHPTRSPSVPADVDAAFCEFFLELAGPFQAANGGLGSALAGEDTMAAARQTEALQQSAARMRDHLAVVGKWPVTTQFAADMRFAIDDYERSLAAALLDPFNPAALTAGQLAYDRLAALAAQIPGFATQYPELEC